MAVIDFSKYTIDRIGEAYVRMNCWEWDDICGPKPDGYDELTGNEKYKLPAFSDAFDQIKRHLSHEQRSMYWWTIALGRTQEAWREWYDETYLRRKSNG